MTASRQTVTVTNSQITSTGVPSGKVLKADGTGATSWSTDLTGAAPGAIDVANLSQNVRDRFEKTAITVLDGTTSSYWTSPDAAAFDITGTIDLRARILPTAWTTVGANGMSLIAKHSAPSNKSYRFGIDHLGRPFFTFSVNGTTSIASLTGAKFMQLQVPPGVPVWVRCRADPTGGASSKARATFYYATPIVPQATDWVTVEFVDSATAGPWFSSSARVLIGLDDSVAGSQSIYSGKIYKAEIRDGSGTLVEDFNADALAPGDTTVTGTNSHVWTAGSSATVVTTNIDMASTLSLFNIFDAKVYGQLSDRTRGVNGVTTSGSATLTGTFQGDTDIGKLVRVLGAGTATSRTDGAMTIGSRDNNILVSAGASFTQALVGQRIVVPGAAAAGADLTARVWGVVSTTQLRLTKPAATSVTGKTYVISKDLYSTITAATTTTATLADTAGTTIASGATYWTGTDDATAIQAAIDACEASTNDGGTVFLHGKSMVGATIRVRETSNLIGYGSVGFSATLGFGTTSLMPGVANMTVFRSGTATASGLSVTGNITSSSTTLTDPNGTFVVGDVGKTIHVLGAGTNVGTSIQQSLQTTISAYTSATQVSLTAAATTTVTNAVYSYESGVANLNGGPMISRIHILGGEGQVCGIHVQDYNEWTLDHVTVSDFYSGIGLYSDGIGGNCQYMDIHSCQFNDCMIGVKAYKGAPNFSGVCTIDGNSNRVDTVPGPGTIGVDCYNGCNMGGVMNIQAYEIGVAVDGHGGGSNLIAPALRVEGCYKGIVLRSDSVNGGNGSIINIISWSASNIGSTANYGLVLLAGVTNTVYNPGFYITTDVDMYGASDATALLSCIRTGDLHLRQTYAATNVSTDRAYDANATTTDELADVLGTLITDLRTLGVVK